MILDFFRTAIVDISEYELFRTWIVDISELNYLGLG